MQETFVKNFTRTKMVSSTRVHQHAISMFRVFVNITGVGKLVQ